MQCNNCGGLRFTFFRKVEGQDHIIYDLFACVSCHLISVMPLPESMNHFYNTALPVAKQNLTQDSSWFANRCALGDAKKRLDIVEAICPQVGSRLLDIGCGPGLFLSVAKRRGYVTKGIEIDSTAVLACQAKDLDVALVDVDNSLLDNESCYDIIALWGVLEHVLKPAELLKASFNMLAKNGILVGGVPNIRSWVYSLLGKRWYHLCPPEHLYYYDKGSLANMLERYGFEVVFLDTILMWAGPTFTCGIRSWLAKHNPKWFPTSSISYCIGLVKRHLVCYPLACLALAFRLEGDSIFFVMKKRTDDDLGASD